MGAPPSQGDTRNGTVPAWCQLIPDDYKEEACRGSGPGCQCSEWCISTPPFSRQWNPECCGCEGGSLPTHQNGTEQGLVPAWCKFVPSDLRSEACRRCRVARTTGRSRPGATSCRVSSRVLRLWQ